jgi:hypothetical protein
LSRPFAFAADIGIGIEIDHFHPDFEQNVKLSLGMSVMLCNRRMSRCRSGASNNSLFMVCSMQFMLREAAHLGTCSK